MLTGTPFLDHLADLLAAGPAPGSGAAGRGHLAHGGRPVGDDGADGSIGDAATDADDHCLNLKVTFNSN